MKVKIAVLLVASVALLAAGCGSKKKSSSLSSTTPTTAAAPVKAPGARVTLVAPKKRATVSGAVAVTVKVTGFKLDSNNVGKAAQQGYGHLHFSMDGGKYDYEKYSGPNGKLAATRGVQGKYSPSVTPTITYKGLPKGAHTLKVYLANNDDSNTGVEAKTTFVQK